MFRDIIAFIRSIHISSTDLLVKVSFIMHISFRLSFSHTFYFTIQIEITIQDLDCLAHTFNATGLYVVTSIK